MSSYFAPDGKRRYVSAKKKGEAEKALRRAMADADRGLMLDAGMLTLGVYLEDKWLPDIKDTVRRKTFVQYESVVRCHLAPVLGRLKLVSLTLAHVRALYRSKLGSGLAPRTVQYIHTTLHKALKQAVMDDLWPPKPNQAVTRRRRTISG